MAGIALVTLHGMGNTPRGYEVPLLVPLSQVLPAPVWERLHLVSVYYQDVFQANQERYLDAATAQARLDWRDLREFVLYGFSDAAGLLYAKGLPGSAYERVQRRIVDALRRAYALVGPDGTVVVLAQSLGAEVISNYLWDCDPSRTARFGVWKDPQALGLSADEERFCRLRGCRALLTTGCNIPVFVAGLDRVECFAPPSAGFRWLNVYDRDDPLGWPVRALSESHAGVAEDVEINAGRGLRGMIQSMTPLSHSAYWEDDDVIGMLGVVLSEVAAGA